MNLKDKIEKAGIENCMFLVPMRPIRTFFDLISLTSSSDPEFIVHAKISEERYKLKDNYKITLESTYNGFGKEHYYISDLENLITSGTVEFFVRENKSSKNKKIDFQKSLLINGDIFNLDSKILAEAFTVLYDGNFKKDWPDKSKAKEMISIFNGGTMPCCPFENWVACIEYLSHQLNKSNE